MTLLYDLWLKTAVTILRHFYFGFSEVSADLLGFLAVAGVRIVFVLVCFFIGIFVLAFIVFGSFIVLIC